jgi:hypothetical protein
LDGNLSADYWHFLAIRKLAECFALVASYLAADRVVGLFNDLFRHAEAHECFSRMVAQMIEPTQFTCFTQRDTEEPSDIPSHSGIDLTILEYVSEKTSENAIWQHLEPIYSWVGI